MPICSIITPVLNLVSNDRETGFLAMLESIKPLDRNMFEHIIIHGKSDDGTEVLLKNAQEKGYQFKLISDEEPGAYRAMNKSVSFASGNYIYFLNSDDLIHDVKILTSVLEQLTIRDSDFAFGGIVIKNGSDFELRNSQMQKLFHRIPFCHQSMVVKKSMFEELGHFDDRFKIAADYDFILRVFLNGNSFYRYKGAFATFSRGGLSSDKDRNISDKRQIWKKNYSRFGIIADGDLDLLTFRRCLPRHISRNIALDNHLSWQVRMIAALNFMKARVRS